MIAKKDSVAEWYGTSMYRMVELITLARFESLPESQSKTGFA